MSKYLCIKIVSAKPMTRGEYNEYRGWTIPDDENPNDNGYIIQHNSHISWIPKNEFENTHYKLAK